MKVTNAPAFMPTTIVIETPEERAAVNAALSAHLDYMRDVGDDDLPAYRILTDLYVNIPMDADDEGDDAE